MERPFIDTEKCTNCFTCKQICPMKVFDEKDKKIFVLNPEKCVACKACELNCPKQAIEVKPY